MLMLKSSDHQLIRLLQVLLTRGVVERPVGKEDKKLAESRKLAKNLAEKKDNDYDNLTM